MNYRLNHLILEINWIIIQYIKFLSFSFFQNYKYINMLTLLLHYTKLYNYYIIAIIITLFHHELSNLFINQKQLTNYILFHKQRKS